MHELQIDTPKVTLILCRGRSALVVVDFFFSEYYCWYLVLSQFFFDKTKIVLHK